MKKNNQINESEKEWPVTFEQVEDAHQIKGSDSDGPHKFSHRQSRSEHLKPC